MNEFRTAIGEHIFNQKYAHEGAMTWDELSDILVKDVIREDRLTTSVTKDTKEEIARLHKERKWIAGGRYLYYAGRRNKYFNNCFLLKAEEDSREDWSNLTWKAQSCLMTGGGIGIDYSIYRPKGQKLSRTGGVSSGPLSMMKIINEVGREVMQGGSRRSAMYASLNWRHSDAYNPEKRRESLMWIKNWYDMKLPGDTTVGHMKEADFNYPAPLDMTNISLNYDNKFLESLGIYGQHWFERRNTNNINWGMLPEVFKENCIQACTTGEPGFSFNFFDKENETLRNACTEVTSEDDSDVCNLGSINMAEIETLEEFDHVVKMATYFLLYGTLVADLPYDKVYKVREKNRRLGLGLMGIHEWLLKRGYRYEMTPELKEWMEKFELASDYAAVTLSQELGISMPVAVRAIAPTGTISMIAGTTSGIEPLFAVAYKRRYLKNDSEWLSEYVVDGTAKIIIEKYGIDPDDIETSFSLAKDSHRRIEFQADIQDFIDQGISSTINLPQWGTEHNNPDTVKQFAVDLAKHASRLRGFTCYPDGARGGQPLTEIDYNEAKMFEGIVFKEEMVDVCAIGGKGSCEP